MDESNQKDDAGSTSQASSEPEAQKVAIAAPTAPSAASQQPPPQPTASAPHPYFTKGRSKAQASPLDPATLSSVRQAIPILADHFPAVASILQQQQSSLNFLLDQPPDQLERLVTLAATKSIQDAPPWVHWSKHDMASPPLKADASTKLHLMTSQFRGYRMARASHGVKPVGMTTSKQQQSQQQAVAHLYYFECVLGNAPTAQEILANLPPNARLGPKLQQQLKEALEYEQLQTKKLESENDQHQQQEPPPSVSDEPSTKRLKRQHSDQISTSPKHHHLQIGGHVRLGVSMRTGDLQAPVGYDKWSYAISSAGGIVHQSRLHTDWNQLYASQGDTENRLHPGDVVGCAVLVDGKDNHVRFFQNGQGLGNFVIAKGKRLGGEAFSNIELGTYYPAASLYMGGSLRANFGPHWICPPRKLPAHLKKVLEPVSSLCPPPLSPQEALRVAQPAVQLFAKTTHQQALAQAVRVEAELRCKAHQDFCENHLQWIRQVRQDRGWSVADLPEPASQLLTENDDKAAESGAAKQDFSTATVSTSAS